MNAFLFLIFYFADRPSFVICSRFYYAVALLSHGDAMPRRPSVSHGDIMRPEIQAMFHVEHIILYSSYPAEELFSAFIKRHGDA